MKNTFFDLDTMSQKNGCIIESSAVQDTIRALAIIDFHMYLVIATAGTDTYFYSGKMHRIYNSINYHGHYIVQFQDNTQYWYCLYLHSIGYPPRLRRLDLILYIFNRLGA